MQYKSIIFLAISLLATACTTTSPLVSDAKVIVPASMQSVYDEFQYAPAVKAGSTLYLSGVVAQLEGDETSSNIVPAIERAFKEIELVLAESGSGWQQVVDVTVYLSDLDAQIGPLWSVKAQRVPPPHVAWTAIGVDRLYGGEKALMEIKVTAYQP